MEGDQGGQNSGLTAAFSGGREADFDQQFLKSGVKASYSCKRVSSSKKQNPPSGEQTRNRDSNKIRMPSATNLLSRWKAGDIRDSSRGPVINDIPRR